jgi:hypothetical protein
MIYIHVCQVPPTLSGEPENLTLADVQFGRGQTILLKRERIKRYIIRSAAAASKERPLNLANR